MGGERTRAGKLVYICAAGLIFFVLSGCMTFKKEFNESTSQEVTPEKVSKPEESTTTACELLLRSKRLLPRGDYAGSLKDSQRVLSLPGKNHPKDQALFQMGLIYAHVDNPQKDFAKALEYFRRVIKDYPKSPLAEEARVWAGVLQENEKLSQVIEKSKQVDIAVEEKKREKAR
jgi:tetratricopeptide (TPR) repeat protein